MARPLGGGVLYIFRRFINDSIAHITFFLVTRDLMFWLWAYSFLR